MAEENTQYWCWRIRHLKGGGTITETRCISDNPQDIADVVLNLIDRGEIQEGEPAYLTIAAEDLYPVDDWVTEGWDTPTGKWEPSQPKE